MPCTPSVRGSQYWKEIVNFGAFVGHGMIDPEDLALFRFADHPAGALELLQKAIAPEPEETMTPSVAHSRTPHH